MANPLDGLERHPLEDLQELSDDRLVAVAAGVVFYALLADATYGSLGAAIGLMMWLWISTIVILFGAELNSEIEHQTARDSTVGGKKPVGKRGAAMADTVGPAAD